MHISWEDVLKIIVAFAGTTLASLAVTWVFLAFEDGRWPWRRK